MIMTPTRAAIGISPTMSPSPTTRISRKTSPQAGLMQIGELAEQTGLSLRTIRHYDDEGLLTPSARSAGGFRLYSRDDLERLLVIRRMKPLGFSIDEMRDLLTLIHDLAVPDLTPARRTDLGARLTAFIGNARDRREKLRTQLGMAEEFVERLEELQKSQT